VALRIPYVREIGSVLALAAFLAYTAWMYRLGGTEARKDCTERENAELKAERAQVEYWQKQAFDKDEALRKALSALPKTGSKVERVVHDHPTSPACVVPDAVVDALQDGIDAGKPAAAP
jgi:hypothetical protein